MKIKTFNLKSLWPRGIHKLCHVLENRAETGKNVKIINHDKV